MKFARILSFASIAAAASSPLAGCGADAQPPASTTSATTGVGGATTTSGSGGQGGAPDPTTTTGGSIGASGGELPERFTVSGVVTDGDRPLEGAFVLQGGAARPATTTGRDGAYEIELTRSIPGTPTIVATKIGYRTHGVEFESLPDGPVEIALRYVTPPDNDAYVYGDPGTGAAAGENSTKYCSHCHTSFVAQFQTSAHAKATRDPLVQDLYAGVASGFETEAECVAAGGTFRKGLLPGSEATAISKCYVGAGVLPDLNPTCAGDALTCDDPALPPAKRPTSFGSCADCHAAGIDGKAGGRNLHEAVGIAYENGNHCDVCHHVRDIDPAKPPGTGGRLVMQRPRDKLSDDPGAHIVQVMFGPLLDVPNTFMGGSYQPKFSTGEFCSGCHEQKQQALIPGAELDRARWPDGLPTHSTYGEWSEGPFAAAGTHCQFCHMPADDTGLRNTVDVTQDDDAGIVFGFVRPPEQIRKHLFRGPLEGAPRLLDGAAVINLNATVDSTLAVDVAIKNIGCGHGLPTGEPMRALVLLVHAEGCGTALAPVGGMTIDAFGGAVAEGTVGQDVVASGDTLAWSAAAARATPGQIVRAVRPSGAYDDYAGIGFFADPALLPEEKGLPVLEPVGAAAVLSAGDGSVVLDAALNLQPGDRVYLGDALDEDPTDGAASRALGGAAGYTFARRLVGSSGELGVPHYRAVDMASDNRIAPQAEVKTTHRFALPTACRSGSVTATLIYRPVPVQLARERGWPANDFVMATSSKQVAFP